MAWASPYVGYGYQNGLVKGMGASTFGYGQLVTKAQFLTMLLRVLQYEDGTDLTGRKSAELAGQLGLPVDPSVFTVEQAKQALLPLLGKEAAPC